jgi:hypothetical protein
MSGRGPAGFDFAAVRKAQPNEQKPGEKEKEKDRAPREPKEKKQDNKLLAATLLLGESLPFLRKHASYKMNWNGTKEGELCQALVDRIDALLKSMTG